MMNESKAWKYKLTIDHSENQGFCTKGHQKLLISEVENIKIGFIFLLIWFYSVIVASRIPLNLSMT